MVEVNIFITFSFTIYCAEGGAQGRDYFSAFPGLPLGNLSLSLSFCLSSLFYFYPEVTFMIRVDVCHQRWSTWEQLCSWRTAACASNPTLVEYKVGVAEENIVNWLQAPFPLSPCCSEWGGDRKIWSEVKPGKKAAVGVNVFTFVFASHHPGLVLIGNKLDKSSLR